MLNNNILQKKQVPNNIKDVLFSYFVNEPYTIALAKNKGQPVEESILTPSCGVGHLPELIKENPLEEFENVIFCLDADDAGNKAKEEIAILNPRYKFFSGLLEGEDWELYYKRQRSI